MSDGIWLARGGPRTASQPSGAAISRSLTTVFQLRAVASTPIRRSAFWASVDEPAPSGDRIVWHYPRADELAHLELSALESQFFLDMQFALHVTLTKDAMGAWCAPALALYETPQPAHAEAIADAYRTPPANK